MTSPIGEPEEISIDTILNDPILKERVLQFCAKQYSEENILFIDQFLTIRSLELSSDEKIIDQQRSDIFSMFDKFFSEYAPLELNIPVKEKKDLLESWNKIDLDGSPIPEIVAVFEHAYNHVKTLVHTSVILPFLRECRSEMNKVIKSLPQDSKRVVIIGGGACGMMLTYYLRQMEHFHVVLIDKKPFWENTPMVIAALANPDDWASKILYPYDKMIPEGRGKFIQGGISKLNKDSVETNGGTIPFDYCVLCTGSSYKQFVKSNAMSAAFREKTLKSNHKKLLNAKSILIVGAGLVGVELAAEFKCIYPEKHVVLVDRHDKVVKRSFPGASTKIYNYLVKIGVEVRLEETVLTFNSKTNTYKTSKGEIKAEAIYLCTGIYPNSGFVRTLDPNLLDENQYVKTRPDLRLEGYDNIFVGGDLKNLNEEKVAIVANGDAFLIMRNLIKMEIGLPIVSRGEKKAMPLQMTPMCIILLGPPTSAFILRSPMNVFMMGKWVSNMKRGFADTYLKIWNGEMQPPNFYGKAPNVRKKALLALKHSARDAAAGCEEIDQQQE